MPDETQKQPPARRKLISDPAAAAEISESDVDNAVAQWRRDVPPQYRELLDAEPIEPTERI